MIKQQDKIIELLLEAREYIRDATAEIKDLPRSDIDGYIQAAISKAAQASNLLMGVEE